MQLFCTGQRGGSNIPSFSGPIFWPFSSRYVVSLIKWLCWMSITIYCTKFQIRQARRLARWIFISTSKGIAKKSVQSSVIKTLWPPCLTEAMIWNTKLIWKKLLRLWSKVRGEDMSWEQAKQVNKYLFILKEKYVDWGEQIYWHWRILGGQWLKVNCISDYGMYCRFSSAMRAKACSARSTIRMCGSSSGSDWCRNFTLSQLYLLLFPRMPRDLVAILNGGKRC